MEKTNEKEIMLSIDNKNNIKVKDGETVMVYYEESDLKEVSSSEMGSVSFVKLEALINLLMGAYVIGEQDPEKTILYMDFIIKSLNAWGCNNGVPKTDECFKPLKHKIERVFDAELF